MSKTAPKCADCPPGCPGYGQRGSCHYARPAVEWWEAFFDGVVRRNDKTPDDILDICLSWFDGKRSAMWKFTQGVAVKPDALMREASKALGENNQGPAEDARLQRLIQWAIRQDQMCDAARALREASVGFQRAAAGLDMDAYDTAQLRAAAERSEQ